MKGTYCTLRCRVTRANSWHEAQEGSRAAVIYLKSRWPGYHGVQVGNLLLSFLQPLLQ